MGELNGEKELNGTRENIEKLSDEFIKGLYKKLHLTLPKSDGTTMSFLEIAMCHLISGAIRSARKAGINDDAGLAAYAVGVLSARLSLKEIDIVEKKKSENPTNEEHPAPEGYSKDVTPHAGAWIETKET